MTSSASDRPPGRRPSRQRWIRPLVLTVGLALVGAGGWYAWSTWGGGRPVQPEYLTAVVQRGDIEDLVTATGSLQPRNYVDVGAQVSGQLRKLHVDVGSEVNEGDLLAEIDATTSVAKVDASRAQLRSLAAQLAEREVALVKAERDLQRQKNLLAEEATTIEAMQNADTTYRGARAQINSLKAQIDQLQASMRVDEANLKFTRIYAPISGTVVSITARQGQTLNANQQAPTILRVADLSTMSVQSQVSEADVSKLRKGMDVYFTTLGSQSRRWNGQLTKVEPTPTVTNNVVLYNALFEVPNPNGSLMTQMTAQVFFVVARAQDALMVPMSALTLQRGPAREPDRSPRGGGSDRRSPQPQPQSSQSSQPTPPSSPSSSPPSSSPSSSSPSSSAPPTSVPAGAGPRPISTDAPPAQPRPPMDREAWEKMTPEQRQALREQRRAERERMRAQEDGGGAATMPGERPRDRGSDGERSGPREATRDRAREGPAERAPDAAANERPIAPSRPAGRAGTDTARPDTARPAPGASPLPATPAPAAFTSPTPTRPRRATVKVQAEDGTLQEREVLIGVSNRVYAEVLSGLAAGDRVITGIRQPDRGNASSNTTRSALGAAPFGPPGAGGPPPGAGMGPTAPAGAGRSR